jgi:hypothetical protein
MCKLIFVTTFFVLSNLAYANYCPEIVTNYSDGSYGSLKTQSYASSRQCSCTIGTKVGPRIDSPENFGHGRIFPLSQKWLDNYFTVNKQCPDEIEFQKFLVVVRNEIEQRGRAEAEFEKEREKERASKRITLQRFCKGIPRISAITIESFANWSQVHPNSISLSRVIYNENAARCDGVFYMPYGAKTCALEFDSNGVVHTSRLCRN